MRGLFLLAAVLGCISCVSPGKPPKTAVHPGDMCAPEAMMFDLPAGDAFGRDRWITRPSDSALVVVGIAGRRKLRGEAVAEALDDAARRVSLYYGVSGETSTILQSGSNNLDYFAATDYSLSIGNDPALYRDSLVFDEGADVHEMNGAVYVRARYPGVSPLPFYDSPAEGGVPRWVRDYALEIPGFMAGIGASKNKGSPQKTYRASYEDALVSLLPRLSSRIDGSVIDTAGGRRTENRSVSGGSVSGVVILETWFDKKSNTVWTLLAAKAGEEDV